MQLRKDLRPGEFLRVGSRGQWPMAGTILDFRANASKISLHISSHSDLSVEITDNGNGLPEGADMGEGNGLRNIRKRILSLQGRIEIRSQNGTRIRFSIPLANIGNEGSIVGAART